MILRIGIVLATVLVLACAAQKALSFLVSPHDHKLSTFVVHVQGKETAHPAAPDREVHLDALIVGGRRLRFDSLERSGSWEPVEKSVWGALMYRESSKPALLTFQASSFVTVFWIGRGSGVVRVERDGTEAQVADLDTLQGWGGRTVVESPAVPPSLVVFVVALVLLAGCAWVFGPVRAGHSSVPWLIFFLSVLHILFWASQCVGTYTDSVGYLQTVSMILRGFPGYFPPGYPALLGLVGAVSGESLGRWVTLIQHGMVVVGSLWIYLLLRRIVREEAALLGAILAGALTPSLTMAQAVMSETPTLFAMVGAVYFAVRSAESGRLLFAILAGVLTGWAGTLRVIPLAALLPSICIVYLLPSAKRRLRHVGVTVVLTAVVVLLPMLWCWYKSGSFMLANSSGFHLFDLVVAEQKLLDEDGPVTRIFLTLLEGKDPRGMPQWEITALAGLRTLGYDQVELLLRKVSLEAIRQDPWGFVLFTPPLAWKELLGDPMNWIPAWGTTTAVHPRLESPTPLPFTASGLSWRWTLERADRVLWPIICWTAVAGTLLGMLFPQRILILALAWVPAGYLLSTAALEMYVPRYHTAIIPFVAALSMVPLGLVQPRQ